jgi:hypothetical protein
MNRSSHSNARDFVLVSLLASACSQAKGAEYIERPVEPLDQAAGMTNSIAHREWLRWWIFDVSPRVSAQALYDDNITISSGATKKGDFIFAATPGLTAIAGDTLAEGARLLTISYAPTFIKFVDHSQYDAIDHAASIHGIWPFSRLTLGFGQTFDQSSGGVVDVGNRVERQTYATSLTSAYNLSEKTSFEINGRQTISDYPAPLIGTREWSNDDWINYLVAAKVTLGLGLTFGHTELDQNPNQNYERLLLRAVYNLTYKIDLTASVGGELRQYQERNKFGAIFSLGASYWPRDGTTLSVEAHRDNRNSALMAGQNYVSTGFSATVRQRMIERLFLSVGGSYENAKYESAVIGVAATRSEDYYLAHVSADIAITDRWLAGLFFRHRENVSNTAGLSFKDNQFGLQTSYQF